MIDIVYIGTSEYASAIRVSAESAIRRARDPKNVRIHMVTDESHFPDIGYDVRMWNGKGRKRWHGTELVWSRIDFAELFPDCDWVISCDADSWPGLTLFCPPGLSWFPAPLTKAMSWKS